MKPNIMIVGRSGSGKSSSLRNLDPERTIILNLERKALPFRNAKDFKMCVPVADLGEFNDNFEKALESDKADVVVIESFTGLTEAVLRDAKRKYTNWDVWEYYNKEIDRILHLSKNSKKYVIFTAIDDVLESEGGVTERFVKVDGKVWKKKVEKEFVMVLFTNVENGDDGVKYQFLTNTDGYNSAKSPMEMLDRKMGNDVNEVIKKAEEYYG